VAEALLPMEAAGIERAVISEIAVQAAVRE
jgi:hypothetical protein